MLVARTFGLDAHDGAQAALREALRQHRLRQHGAAHVALGQQQHAHRPRVYCARRSLVLGRCVRTAASHTQEAFLGARARQGRGV